MINASSPPRKLPAARDAAPLFAMLFGNDTACKLRKDPIPADDCAVVATYRDTAGVIQRLLACDLAFANSAGAALSLQFPPQPSKTPQTRANSPTV